MQQPETYEERQILQLLASGDELAFNRLFDHYRAKIYSVAMHFLKSPVLAEEIIQDVFLKIWLKRAELPGIQRFDAYLFITARNIIFDRLKKQAYETATLGHLTGRDMYTADTDHSIRQHQFEALLDEAVSHLPPQQKHIFRLAKTEGLSHELIARRLNISRLTVKKQMSRALRYLRQYLNKYTDVWLILPLLISYYRAVR
jgi:RNA polymerase sigma-70 factor (ECF subfamily)